MKDFILKQGDCLKLMQEIKDKSVDMICCDLPYGTTSCKWDTVIPFDKLWEQYNRIIKIGGAIVLNGSQPFTSNLIVSNIKNFKYCWVWEKTKATGHLNAKIMPMKNHEDICVFSNGKIKYNPQGTIQGEFKTSRKSKLNKTDDIYGEEKEYGVSKVGNYPKTIIKFANPSGKGHFHPTQKPLELCKYLIKTYTKEGDTVLDNCMGSGTTGVACKNLNRNFIGYELDENYFSIAKERIELTPKVLTKPVRLKVNKAIKI